MILNQDFNPKTDCFFYFRNNFTIPSERDLKKAPSWSDADIVSFKNTFFESSPQTLKNLDNLKKIIEEFWDTDLANTHIHRYTPVFDPQSKQ